MISWTIHALVHSLSFFHLNAVLYWQPLTEFMVRNSIARPKLPQVAGKKHRYVAAEHLAQLVVLRYLGRNVLEQADEGVHASTNGDGKGLESTSSHGCRCG